jgi:hypothetical protein
LRRFFWLAQRPDRARRQRGDVGRQDAALHRQDDALGNGERAARTVLWYQTVGTTRYFAAAGFPGRTVGVGR